MVITFEEERQSPIKKYVIFAVFIAVLGGVGYFGYRYFSQQSAMISDIPAKKVEVNWAVLKDPQLDQLDPFQEIGAYEGDFGKENPFD